MISGKCRPLFFLFPVHCNKFSRSAMQLAGCTSTTPVYPNGVFSISVVLREVNKLRSKDAQAGFSVVRLVPGLLPEILSLTCVLSFICSACWALEWDDQDYTHSLRGSCLRHIWLSSHVCS